MDGNVVKVRETINYKFPYNEKSKTQKIEKRNDWKSKPFQSQIS